MNGRRWLIALAILAAIASQAFPADRNYPKLPPVNGSGSGWVGSAELEIIGAAFATLPEPYVSVQIKTTAALDGVPVTAEARTSSTQRVTLSVAEATALRDALDAWLANPTTTTTLAAKSY